MRSLIEGGDIVAYAGGGHRLLRGGVLVFEDDHVSFVGTSFTGAVDRRIDASGKLVIPGLVNIHCHADVEAGGRLVADVGRRDYFHTGFLNYFAARKGVKALGARRPSTGRPCAACSSSRRRSCGTCGWRRSSQ